jgi:hypothetical protein
VSIHIHAKTGRTNILTRLIKSVMVRENRKIPSMDLTDEDSELLENIWNAKNEWMCANMNFEHARGPEMVDYYTYKIKACQVRYEYFLKKAKDKGLRLDFLQHTDLPAYPGSEIKG